jgi:preprotein translocase subunit Sss1
MDIIGGLIMKPETEEYITITVLAAVKLTEFLVMLAS